MESTRLKKVSRLIQKDLGEIFRMESRALFSGAMITATQVRVSPDLSIARVYVSIFALGTTSQEEIYDQIVEHSKLLRLRLGERIRHQVRAVPSLSFFLDDSLDYIDNIEQLLKQ